MKSFSVMTKNELCKTEYSSNSSAEFAGMLLFGGTISEKQIKFVTENPDVMARFEKLCRDMGVEITISKNSKTVERYNALCKNKDNIFKILRDYELTDSITEIVRYKIPKFIADDEVYNRSFIKGAFLSGGTIIDPSKNYNLEFVTAYMGLCNDFVSLLLSKGFDFKIAKRKSKYVIYIKNSETISDFLSYIGAYNAQMNLINIKIEKEIHNDFNRAINSEAANYDKTISAAIAQIQAIKVIDKAIGIEELPDDLKEIAKLRLKNGAVSLQELGKMLKNPIGKSGVNHRFQRIIALADKLNKGE